MPQVKINGHAIENVMTFEYLGCKLAGDGDDTNHIKHRTDIGQVRFSSLFNIWQDSRLTIKIKLDLHKSSVCTTQTHGSEAWTLIPISLKRINGFNSRCLHHITGRTYREEAVNPTFNLVAAIRRHRKQWLGHILRLQEDSLLRTAVCSLASSGPLTPLDLS